METPQQETTPQTPQNQKTNSVQEQVGPESNTPLAYGFFVFCLLLGIFASLFVVPNYIFGYFVSPTHMSIYADNLQEELVKIENTDYSNIRDRIKFEGLAFTYVDFHLPEFPQELTEHHLIPERMTFLMLEGMQLESIEGISGLPNMETLLLIDNKIKEVPAEISTLENLKELRLGGNNLTNLPPEIGRLQNLEILLLYDNKITQVPSEIGNLVNLKTLDLHRNNLTSLPNSIGNLENLEILYLGGNDLSEEEQQKIQNLLPNTQIYF